MSGVLHFDVRASPDCVRSCNADHSLPENMQSCVDLDNLYVPPLLISEYSIELVPVSCFMIAVVSEGQFISVSLSLIDCGDGCIVSDPVYSGPRILWKEQETWYIPCPPIHCGFNLGRITLQA